MTEFLFTCAWEVTPLFELTMKFSSGSVNLTLERVCLGSKTHLMQESSGTLKTCYLAYNCQNINGISLNVRMEVKRLGAS